MVEPRLEDRVVLLARDRRLDVVHGQVGVDDAGARIHARDALLDDVVHAARHRRISLGGCPTVERDFDDDRLHLATPTRFGNEASVTVGSPRRPHHLGDMGHATRSHR